MTTESLQSELAAERDALRERLAEAEEILRAIRSGEVDAVVVTGERGEQVHTLMEQKLHEQIVVAERLARLILDQAAEAIVVCDEQGRIIRASQAAQALCNGSPLQRPFAEVLPLQADGSGPFQLTPVLRGETLRSVDVALDRRGQRMDLIMNAGPLRSDREILGCVVTLTDITERKLAEKKNRFQLEELQRWQDAMLDREDRVQDLKREINQLSRRLGEPLPYANQEGKTGEGGE